MSAPPTQATFDPAQRRPVGRPTRYRPELAGEETTNLCLLGLTDDDLARFWGTNRETIWEWQQRFPEFADAIARGRDQADARVAGALWKRAVGYDVEQSKVGRDGEVVTWTQHIPGDFNAMSLILRNRQAARWRERTEVVHDISDRVAERLESARLRMIENLRTPMTLIDGEADTVSAEQPSNPRDTKP